MNLGEVLLYSKRTGQRVVIDAVDLVTYNNCFKLRWQGSDGFGELTFYQDEDGLNVESESLADNDNKQFIKLVLNKFIEDLNVVE